MQQTRWISRVDEAIWEIAPDYKKGMRVPARICATEQLLEQMDEGVVEQLTNVAMLPGIVDYALCMPDGHTGYGFPIGGVAAMDPKTGVISPGGIGFDINCGMRLVTTNLSFEEVAPRMEKLIGTLFDYVPAGVGGKGGIKVKKSQFASICEQGAPWCVEHGYGWPDDTLHTEEQGCIAGADVAKVSQKAIERGYNQIGTLGSGNHYLEVQVARPEDIIDEYSAGSMGISRPNQVVVMFHCGSRGFGHQVATDYLQVFLKVMGTRYGIHVNDRELACAPFHSPEGQDYMAAMRCAANMAFANRQIILHRVRTAFEKVFGRDAMDLGMHQVYDVCHNVAKLEKHRVDGKEKTLLVHRKGSTRAFGPGMEGIPDDYRDIGQPVIIGGSMETGSYLLVGIPEGAKTFYSTTHGSGRAMSRRQARGQFRGQEIRQRMLSQGIISRSVSLRGLSEEAGGAYKNIDDVILAATKAGISKPVVRFTPVGNVKG